MFSTHHIKKRGDYILSMENGKSKNADYVKLVAQIDKYWHKLFCDPITVLTPDGGTVILQPQRTNNILERFFRDLKSLQRIFSHFKDSFTSLPVNGV